MGETFRTAIILATALCIASCAGKASRCRDTDNASFVLKLTLKESERSKDSHWISHTLNIADRHACWATESGGFLAAREKSGSRRLDDTAFDRLRNYIGTYGPRRDILETKPAEGPGRSVSLDMELFMDGKTTRVSISGMLNAWTRRSGDRESNIENIDIVNRARSIIGMIKTGSE